MEGSAYFVFRPRTSDDLSLENPTGKWRKYRIVKAICLPQIDFENFAADLLADRQFIEDHSAFCTGSRDCLLVTNHHKGIGLLIIPWHGCFVREAALLPVIRFV